MARQLSFDLPSDPQLGRDDFLQTPANTVALAMIENWRDWDKRKLALTGPKGAGKTHLTHIWAQSASATILPAQDLPQADVLRVAARSVAVEDIDTIAGDDASETALFHLHNLVLAEGHWLLLTGSGAPKSWPFALPDLKSRIEGTISVALDPPDDALLAAVLAKLFADRQLSPRPDVIAFLVTHMDRTLDAARHLVARIDNAAL
ncbi:MAG: DnaA/Hda family protein [Pseudomonadota bacterium]